MRYRNKFARGNSGWTVIEGLTGKKGEDHGANFRIDRSGKILWQG